MYITKNCKAISVLFLLSSLLQCRLCTSATIFDNPSPALINEKVFLVKTIVPQFCSMEAEDIIAHFSLDLYLDFVLLKNYWF
jgi:hypothetical protein